jgi:acyl dehydratase
MAEGFAELGAPCWMTVDQDRINEFAECAGNRQWMRVDLQRAKRESTLPGITRASTILPR